MNTIVKMVFLPVLLLAVALPIFAEPAVSVAGYQFEVDTFEEEVLAFRNRKYVYKDIPETLRGFSFTRADGGGAFPYTVTALKDTTLWMASPDTKIPYAKESWIEAEGVSFYYTDANKTRLNLRSYAIKKGETITVHSDRFTGAVLLAESITVKPMEAEVEPDLSLAPGVVIAYSPAYSQKYIGSPSIAVLPDGRYVASHDFFGTGSQGKISRIYRSEDRGKTWTQIAELDGAFWSNLFVHQDALYCMGASARYGAIVIRRSEDGGATWTDPVDAQTGLLKADREYHTAPMPMLVHNGRIWRTFEDSGGPGGWGTHFRAFMMSAPVDADLLDAASWTYSNPVVYEEGWLDGQYNGFLEGNAVLSPDGELLDILRADLLYPDKGKAAIVHISPDGKQATFDPEKDFIDFPGGCKKFDIGYDPESKLYWSLTNYIPGDVPEGKRAGNVRNTLALTVSANLRDWEVRSILLRHPDVRAHGFQYVSWQFDGNDLIAAIRTACADGVLGARNAHDANFLVFLRVPEFRERTMETAPLWER